MRYLTPRPKLLTGDYYESMGRLIQSNKEANRRLKILQNQGASGILSEDVPIIPQYSGAKLTVKSPIETHKTTFGYKWNRFAQLGFVIPIIVIVVMVVVKMICNYG